MRRNSKENKRQHAPSKQSESFWSRVMPGLQSGERRGTIAPLIGLVLFGIGIYLFFAYLSYFITGAKDQGVVMNQTLSETLNEGTEVAGHAGASGAFWMHALVNNFLGIPIIFLIYYVIVVGGNLMRLFRINYLTRFIFCTASAFWLSLFLTWACKPLEDQLFFLPGGRVGVAMYEGLTGLFGVLGVILILVVSFCAILFLSFRGVSQRYMEWTTRRRERVVSQVESEQIAEEVVPTLDTDPVVVPVEEKVPVEPAPQPSRKTKKRDRSWTGLLRRAKEVTAEDEPTPKIVNSEGETVNDLYTPPEATSPADTERVAQAPIENAPTLESKPSTAEEDVSLEIIDSTRSDDSADPEELAAKLVSIHGEYDPRLDLGHYRMPPIDLLEERAVTQKIDEEEIRKNKEQIISTLRSFKLEISSITATVGPTITLYEVVPQTGVKISQIRNLEDDIALSLAALGIRIIAPIPGKGTVGIEVPNKNPQIVSMRSVIASRKFQESKMELPVALGRTITNDVFTFDLTKVPHLLVAGATGQGKSVGLNAIITSLLYKKHPAELKFVMVDPKMVEFSIYSVIERHYLAKLPTEKDCIITDTNRVIATLNSLCREMDDRYDLLMRAKVRNIKEYNEKFKNRRLNPERGHRYMPYIVVVIDEYGDLIMTAGKEIELPIARLAQKARAVGMHAIIATQRPTASIITGTIKANFPGRMSFRVFSMIDSRTILDAPGANRLVGKGDLLFSQGNEFIRVQCAFVDTPEVTRLVEYIAGQQGYSSAYELPEVPNENATEGGSVRVDERDPLFEQAARILVMENTASTSLLQRKFSIGYNRAGRLMDQLEAEGVVGKQDGSKPREVLMTESQLEMLLS